MNLIKSFEFFHPSKMQGPVHIIGCGSVGSTLADMLVRCGLTNIHLWDMDVVEDKNIVNQHFFAAQVGMKKTDAVRDNILAVNPECKLTPHDGWNGERLEGYVMLAVDNIDLRRDIVKKCQLSGDVMCIIDIRTRLTEAQCYGCDCDKPGEYKVLLDSMDFTHEEAAANNEVTACGVTLGVCTTVHMVCAAAVQQLRNYVEEGTIKRYIYVNINGDAYAV